jgi:phosphoenolpyruvate-protein phosphotransferase
MDTIKGIGVCGGVVFGKMLFYKRGESQVKRREIKDVSAELSHFAKAKEQAIVQLQELYDTVCAEVGEDNAMIFEVHQMMLADGDYESSIIDMIKSQSINAEYAVSVTGDNFAQMFESMDDAYMKERAADVKDISKRLVRILSGETEQKLQIEEPVVLAADDLAPSETVQLDKEKILAFVTREGSTNSHTAILARMMDIPAIVGMGDELKESHEGNEVFVDGSNGVVYVNPDEETTTRLMEMAEEERQKKQLLEKLHGEENRTLDGKTIDIFANIGSVTDVEAVLQNDAGGVGLFRSEFLYLQSDRYPTEEEQFEAYKAVAETMDGRKVVIRTLDIGADKQIEYFDLPKEENPAMGYRAIRICLERPEVFKAQLRALYRASAYGNLAIMFPMITAVKEIMEIKEIIKEVKQELDAMNIAYAADMEIGVMIETPAAVMISDLLAKEVDFFSVGTNDLTQYTLALDRQNIKLERFHDAHHIGILRMLRMAAENAHKEGKWIGICGELAADTGMTETFLALGIDELSVSPPYVLSVRDKVRKANVEESRARILEALL